VERFACLPVSQYDKVSAFDVKEYQVLYVLAVGIFLEGMSVNHAPQFRGMFDYLEVVLLPNEVKLTIYLGLFSLNLRPWVSHFNPLSKLFWNSG
jgi:hypothetical protein